MGKLALGKGMKDLLPKSKGSEIVEKLRREETDLDALRNELQVNIERFQTQGYNVTPLKDLIKKKGPKVIREGIERYLESVKTLTVAHTHLKSIEGFGYKDEIEVIMERIKDPVTAREVLKEAEELKDRVSSEHVPERPIEDEKEEEIPQPPVEQPPINKSGIEGVLIPTQEAEEATAPEPEEEVSTPEPESDIPAGEDLTSMDVDSLLDDLEELGEVFETDDQEEGQAKEPPRGDKVQPDGEPPQETIGAVQTEVEAEMPPIPAGEEGPPMEKTKNGGEVFRFPKLSTKEVLEKAKNHYMEAEYKPALEMTEEVMRRDPENPTARFLIGRIKRKME